MQVGAALAGRFFDVEALKPLSSWKILVRSPLFRVFGAKPIRV